MKKWMALLLALTLVFALGACSAKAPNADDAPAASEEPAASAEPEASETAEEPVKLNVYMLAGPTGMGAVNMMAASDAGELAQEYEFTVASAPDEVVGKIANSEADIAAISTNLAAKLYAKTEGGVTVLGVNTLGVLSMLEKEKTVSSVADLAGKTIYTTGQGANPQYILEYLLHENGLDPESDVTIVYKTENTELATVFDSDPAAVIMAPQPVATSIVLNSGAVVSLDMTEEWEKVAEDSRLMMGCVVVRNEILEQYPQAVAAFMSDYADSIEKANSDAETTGALCETYGIVAKAVLAQKALPNCNIVWVTADQMKTGLSGYLQVLFDADPTSVGGSMPADDFYYAAE